MNGNSAGQRLLRSRLAILAVAAGAAAFLGGTVAVPLLESTGARGVGLLRLCYTPVCHQQAERSLSLPGGEQAVCARCAGLYAGGIAGLLAGAVALVGSVRRPRPLWLVVALVPTVTDALLAFAGLPSLPNVPRMLLALPLGLVAGLFVALAIADVLGREDTACLPEPIETAGTE